MMNDLRLEIIAVVHHREKIVIGILHIGPTIAASQVAITTNTVVILEIMSTMTDILVILGNARDILMIKNETRRKVWTPEIIVTTEIPVIIVTVAMSKILVLPAVMLET